MKILVINCGSSSIKYQLLDMVNQSVLAKGLCDRIGIDGSKIKHQVDGKKAITIEAPMADHNEAVTFVLDALTSNEYGVIQSMDEINAVGHRIVHGGEHFSESTIITDEVIKAVEECTELAPLHNPANLLGIEVFRKLMPNVPMVGVFDTAFHQTMPSKAYLYGISYEYYKKYKLRRYGFHGTSHKYVANRTAEFLGKNIEDMKIVVCHLGNGASICAVDGGRSIDTSMGFTPLEGLLMGTRSGDLDPAVIQFIANKEEISLDEVIDLLNKKSGILGLSLYSSDFRDIEDAIADGHVQSKVAMDVFEYRVAKYIGSYAAAMNGIDAVVFTAGLGENNGDMRANVCEYLSYLGVEIDAEQNRCRGIERDFSSKNAKVKSLVIPTNEELMIARETYNLIK